MWHWLASLVSYFDFTVSGGGGVMMFNATFNNMSVI